MDYPSSLDIIRKPQTTFPRLPCDWISGVVIQEPRRPREGQAVSYFASWELLGGGALWSLLTDGFLLGIVPGTLPWSRLSSSCCDFVKYKTLCHGDTEMAGVLFDDPKKTFFFF